MISSLTRLIVWFGAPGGWGRICMKGWQRIEYCCLTRATCLVGGRVDCTGRKITAADPGAPLGLYRDIGKETEATTL